MLYLRPAPRQELLSGLAALGVLVVEHQGAAGALETARILHVDLALVVAPTIDAHRELIRDLSAVLDRRVAVIVRELPEGLPPGRLAVLDDVHLARGLPGVVAPMARRARAARERSAAGRQPLVFGELEFQPDPPRMGNGRRELPLSRSEWGVLQRLAAHIGRPVAHIDLESACVDEGPVHPGLLKAVILRIRRKAAELGADPNLLRTIRGYGYVMAQQPRSGEREPHDRAVGPHLN